MAEQKLYLKNCQEFDFRNNQSNVRLVETVLDEVCEYNTTLIIQFYRDWELYGVDEAIMYLDSYKRDGYKVKELDELKRVVEEMRVEMSR
ncbi:MAG: hypothetical protein ACTSVB_11440 [Candidatus Heimdallarchaeaceae archaeon]